MLAALIPRSPEFAHAAIVTKASPKCIAWRLFFLFDVHKGATRHSAVGSIFALWQAGFIILWTHRRLV